MNDIFVDTSWFKAVADYRDDFHERAVRLQNVWESENSGLVTTNFVLDETFTVIRVKRSLERAKQFRRTLLAMESILKVVRVTIEDEANAWKWFVKPWRNLSFTDCTSFAVMRRLALKRVAAFDQHFAKAGFELVS